VHVRTNGKRSIPIGDERRIALPYATKCIVYMLGGVEKRGQSHLDALMHALESFYHPSNLQGSYAQNLLKLLEHLSHSMCSRLKRERFSKSNWTNEVRTERALHLHCIGTG
jgi:hypothetical protein